MGTSTAMFHVRLSVRHLPAQIYAPNWRIAHRYSAAIRAFLVAWILSCSPLLVGAEAFLRNGQFFTKGLAISNAPFPGSPQHAGSDIVISIELSGNGKIDQSLFIPGSGAPTSYELLELYLVSSQTRSNYTVSNGSGLLEQEPGSTVKHLNWPIPSCIAPGVYNLTYYESSRINNEAFFSITPINVTVDNPNRSSDSSQCDSLSNELQDQPQPDSAPDINPYQDPESGLSDSGPANGDTPTITVGDSGLPTQWTIEPSGSTVDGADGAVTTMTMVVLSTATLTETITEGQGPPITTTILSVVTTTVTAVMGTDGVTAGGFFPVNGAENSTRFKSLAFGLFLFACSTIISAFTV